MNKDNILAVADAIEKHSIPDLGFNMGTWIGPAEINRLEDLSGHDCNTVACIAGWAYSASRGNKRAVRGIPGSYVADTATAFLGLTDVESWTLFYPSGARAIQPDQAVRVLRHLAETGKVCWSVATP